MLGQESVMTLAMVSYDQLPARTASVARYDSTTNSLATLPPPRLQYRIAGLKLECRNSTGFSTDFQPEKQNDFCPRDWSRFVCKKSSAEGWTGIRAYVEAGYGQFFQFESSLGAKAAELEQPSFAYLKATFRF